MALSLRPRDFTLFAVSYRIYVFPLISTTVFLFLTDFPSFFSTSLQTCYFKVIQAVSRAHLLLPPLLNHLGNNRPQRGSKNIFRGITMGRGPIWGIHSLSPFILSWYSLLVEMSVSEQKRRGPFHAPVSISQEVNGSKLRFLRVAHQLNNHQKNTLLKVVVLINCHKLNSIIFIKIIANWLFISVYLRGYHQLFKRLRRRRETKRNQKNEEGRDKQKILHCVKKDQDFLIWSV